MAHVFRTHINGDANIGLYSFATDKYCFIGAGIKKKIKERVRKTLKVKIIHSRVMNTELAGIFCCGNSSGIVTSDLVREYNSFEKKIPVLYLETKYTALGNLILMNDKGIVISPLIKNMKKDIEDFFGLKCTVSTVAGIKVTGSCAIATNKGCLVHPQILPEERKKIEKTLCVKTNIGTVNFGSPFVRSGIIANSNGFVVGNKTSGPETGRIDETLGFI